MAADRLTVHSQDELLSTAVIRRTVGLKLNAEFPASDRPSAAMACVMGH